MSRFLDRFPQVPYDITKNGRSNYDRVTDISFRFSIIKDVLNNTSAYYEYVVREDETPEILADRVYDDPEAYWIILYANNIYDPQYDWPLSSDAFEKFIISKYGSISNAKSQIHHYEKIVARQVGNSETVYLIRQEVNYNSSVFLSCTIDNTTANISSAVIGQNVKQIDATTNNTIFMGQLTNIDLPNSQLYLSITEGKLTNYNTLLDASSNNNLARIVTNTHENLEFYLNLPSSPQVTTYNINNKTVTEGITRTAISNYDYELQLNDNKRNIKVIKNEFYPQIINEFNNLTKSNPKFYRKLR